MNRIDRVTAILIQLQSRKVIKAQDIASRFRISLRTVYRDMKTLEEAGIPVIGEAGIGYSIMEGYRLPPIMFTKDEATAFLTAEKLIEKLADASIDESFKNAMYKVRAVLRSTEKDFLEDLDESIHVRQNRQQSNHPLSINTIQPILRCIASKNVLSISYFANHSQENTERKIEPIGIIFSEGFWHVIAWCQLRNDYRDFRIDRIRAIKPTDIIFDQVHPTLKTYLDQIRVERNLMSIVIRVAKDAMPFINDEKYYHGFISQQEVDGQYEMSFLSYSLEGFVRWFIMYADHAEIISPLDLKKKLKAQLSAIEKKLG